VSYDNFLRAFGSTQNIKDIAQSYLDPATRDVNYQLLSEDLQKAIRHRHDAKSLSAPLPPFFEHFVGELFSRGVNVTDAFVQKDRHHKGYISVESFLSVISSFNIELSPSELKQLSAPFLSNGNVDYESFLRKVHETNSAAESRSPPSPVAPLPDVDSVLDRIRARLTLRRIELRSSMEAAARESRGILTRAKFYKVLTFVGFDLIPPDIAALDEAFLSRNGTFDFAEFLDRVDPISAKPAPIDPDAVVARLREHLVGQRVSLSRSFFNFDREKSGTVSVAQLASALGAVGFQASPIEVKDLALRYGNGRIVEWKSLCGEVEPPPSSPIAPAAARPRRDPPPPPVVAFLKRVLQASVRSDVNVRNELVRADLRKRGILSFREFRVAIESLPLKFGTSEVGSAVKSYFSPGTENIVYSDFCDDLEEFGRDKPQQEAVEEEQPPDVNSLNGQSLRALRMLKAAVRCRRLVLEELFVHHDSTRSGTIPLDNVKSVLKPIAPFIGEELSRQIETDFRDKRQPEKFNYRRLCGALAEVRPSQEELIDVAEVQRELAGENEGVPGLANIIREKITARRKSIYDLFVGVKQELIPVEEFRSRIADSGIILSEAEFQKVIRQYGRRRNTEIYWMSFCLDVTASAPLGSGA
jgi:Ca2+-binding EF-hand superfamily protein